MGLVRLNTHKPPLWLPGGHLQTVYPALFREVGGVDYKRERLGTSDGDFLLLDWHTAPATEGNRPLLILSHGFEGDSHRPYIKGMVKALGRVGVDCLAWNYRSCGGELNHTPRFYHSGATDDLDAVVRHAVKAGYQTIFLGGFSLGGNLTLKYLGEERARPAEIARALCFSVPMDLEACSRHLDSPMNHVYQKRFLNSLRVKVKEKGNRHPGAIDVSLLPAIRSVYAFDDVFTGPLHGFRGASDYYTQCSAKHYISSIRVRTLIVNAANDPMVPAGSLPLAEAGHLRDVDLWLTSRGGHCGFLDRHGRYWSEEIAVQFFRG